MEDYTSSLTGEPFLYNETKIIGKFLLNGEEPNQLKKKNIEENLIQYKQPKSISRVNSPIFRRLSVFTKEQLDFFVNDDLQQSKYLLVYAIMKTDKLVKDFIGELYYDKLLMNDKVIESYEVRKWFDNKFKTSENLSKKSDTTKYKLKQVMMQIMNSSGLVKREKTSFKINRPLLSNELVKLINDVGDDEYSKILEGGV